MPASLAVTSVRCLLLAIATSLELAGAKRKFRLKDLYRVPQIGLPPEPSWELRLYPWERIS